MFLFRRYIYDVTGADLTFSGARLNPTSSAEHIQQLFAVMEVPDSTRSPRKSYNRYTHSAQTLFIDLPHLQNILARKMFPVFGGIWIISSHDLHPATSRNT
jgi:hypothetical protein